MKTHHRQYKNSHRNPKSTYSNKLTKPRTPQKKKSEIWYKSFNKKKQILFRILTTTHDHRKSRNTSNAPKTPKFNQTKQHPRIINQIKRGSITKMRSPLTNSASQALTDHRRPVMLAQSSSIVCLMVCDSRVTASSTRRMTHRPSSSE